MMNGLYSLQQGASASKNDPSGHSAGYRANTRRWSVYIE